MFESAGSDSVAGTTDDGAVDETTALASATTRDVRDAAVAAMGRAERTRVATLRAVADLLDTAAWRADGALHPTAWLRVHTSASRREAARVVRLARLLGDLPSAKVALFAGEITTGCLDALAAVDDVHRHTALIRDHDDLVEHARALDLDGFTEVCGHWAHLVDDERDADDTTDVDANRLTLAPTLWGRLDVVGHLDAVAGRTLIAAIDAHTPPPTAADPSSPRRPLAARRADALIALATAALGATHVVDVRDCGTVAAAADDIDTSADSHAQVEPVVQATLNVVVDQRTLHGRRTMPTDLDGIRCDLDRVGVVSPRLARQLACDATVRRVVMDPAGNVVDLGRRTRVVSPTQRAALVIRDRHCMFPGCDRPPQWCDAHHLVPWTQGGRTDLTNLVLLCRRHHTLVHQTAWLLERDPATGAVTARAPDGSAYVAMRARGHPPPPA